MRFVQNHRVHARQQIAEAVLLQRHVCQQQMVVDDHDVGLEGGAARREHMAARELAAAAAAATLARRAELAAQRMRLAEVGQLGQIAAAGGLRPLQHAREQRVGGRRQQLGLPSDVSQTRAAEIIRPPLQQGNARRPADGRGEQRQIAMKQLILKRTGTGGYQHTQARQQRWHQVCVSLARTCPGLYQQNFTGMQGRINPSRHLLLRRARLEIGQDPRERSVSA